MDFSHPLLLRMRDVGRRLGILGPARRLYNRYRNTGNEDNFEKVFLSRILPGETVWDVGANVGYYTARIADLVGETGRVVAFEPSPQTFVALSAAMIDKPNAILVNVALSNFEGLADFHESINDYNRADRLFTASTSDTYKVMKVPVTSGDRYIAKNANLAPTVIKIDVEGFETEVLAGLARHINSSRLRIVFIEIHFNVLASRGLLNAPRDITEMLRNNRFVVWWTDPSHICAER